MENAILDAGINQSEQTDEMIGLLTAISIVSKRMASKLALLDTQSTREKGEPEYGCGSTDETANQSRAV